MFEASSSGSPRRGLNSLWLVVLISLSIFLALLSPFRSVASQDGNMGAHASIFSSSEITITRIVTFERPILSRVCSYDFITMKGCGYLEDIGKPKLPTRNVFLLIPPAATLVDVEVTPLAENTLGDGYFIYPAQPPLPTTSENRSFVAPDPLIYKSSGKYPGNLVSHTEEGNLGGRRILGIRLFPVQYVPKSGEIIFHSKMLIKITYALNNMAPTILTSPPTEFSRLVEKLVLNPESENTYNSLISESPTTAGSTLSPDNVKYTIITSEDFKDNFQVLADWKTKKGVPAKVVTVSWIMNNYPGVDVQEKIRNFIKDVVDNWGTTWVLLGGDTNIIPERKGYGKVEGAAAGIEVGSISTVVYVDNIPADLYYSDLDGNWNADGDNTYGEVEDNVDLYPDVFVGRAPVDSVTEAQTFVDKTLRYEKDPPVGYQKSVLFLAERLDGSTDGGIAKDVIDNDYIPNEFSVTKLYESSGNLNRTAAINNLNSGYGIVNHVGHASSSVLCVGPGFNELNLSDMDSLVNSPKYSVFYSIGCWPAAMDEDSIGEHFVLSGSGGGPVFVGNSRFGWYFPGDPGGGPSDRYDQEFFNSLFVENFYRVGETLAYSKVGFIPESENDGAERWLQYALNLLGDPELPIWTEAPENLVVTHPSEVLTGPRQVTVMVKDNDGNAVENALVCLQKEFDVYVYGCTDSAGKVTFDISPSFPGSMDVTVTKNNFLPYENTLQVLGPGVSVSISPHENSGPPKAALTYIVTVTNLGTENDNYDLTASDNAGWDLALSDNLLEVSVGESRQAALTVTIPENAIPCSEDNITVVATSMADNTVNDDDSCIARAIPPKAEISLVTLYKVGLDLNLYLESGSKLVVKFHTYMGENQGENVIWENVTPAYIVLLENLLHPLGLPVKNATLVLTTDNTEEVISIIASFTVHQSHLRQRDLDILRDWGGHPELHDAFREEDKDILTQWGSAPS